MAKKIKVYDVGYGYANTEWLTSTGLFKSVPNKEDCDIMVFPGGSDWNPAFYGEDIGSRTHCYESIDALEMNDALWGINNNKFMIGLCRGGQLMTILAGGSLIQHVTGHGGTPHEITTFDGKTLVTNSLHHQMFDLVSSMSCSLIAWSTKKLSTCYLNGYDGERYGYDSENKITEKLINMKSFREPEIVYYDLIKGYAIQGHPEMYSMPTNTVQYIIDDLLKRYESADTVRQEARKRHYKVSTVDQRLANIGRILKPTIKVDLFSPINSKLILPDKTTTIKDIKDIKDEKKDRPSRVQKSRWSY